MSYVYDDATHEALSQEGGAFCIQRASHVEPNSDGTWSADMGPCVRGANDLCISEKDCILGPFKTRQEALYAEQEWLEQHLSRL